jgi:carbamoyltransferase
VACFLTTDLPTLVIGDWLVTKREAVPSDWLALRIVLPVTVALAAERRWTGPSRSEWIHEARFTYQHGRTARLSPELYRLLGEAGEGRPLGELGARAGLTPEQTIGLIPELRELWGNRLVILSPA